MDRQKVEEQLTATRRLYLPKLRTKGPAAFELARQIERVHHAIVLLLDSPETAESDELMESLLLTEAGLIVRSSALLFPKFVGAAGSTKKS